MAALEQSIGNESRHAVMVNRFAGGLHRDFIPYLNQLKQEISLRLLQEDVGVVTGRKLTSLLRDITKLQQAIYKDYTKELNAQLNLFTENEINFEVDSLNDVNESDSLIFSTPATKQVWSAVNTIPLVFPDSNDNVLLQPFINNWAQSEIRRVSNIITTGFLTGETNAQIARKISGKGGTLDKQTRRNNAMITRTATNHVSSTARMETMRGNDDVVIGYEWVSTLDSRTTTECRSLDGKVFKWSDSYKPLPPFHIGCRSTTAPVVDQRYRLDDSDSKRASRGSSGPRQTNADTTYYSFLKKQSVAFQNDVLGPTRAKLLRDGGLNAEEFAKLNVDSKFRPLTLDEMKKKNPLSFEKADLD